MTTITSTQIDALLADKNARVHFVGIGGTGMSGYADFRALSGAKTSGSDRGFDQSKNIDQRRAFENRGITIFPQDGSGVDGAAAIVVSVAVEATVPDYARATERNIPIITRKDWLAAHYRAYNAVAITGTSGKSTVTAMVFEILRTCGLDPSLMTGADLKSLLNEGRAGNTYVGTGPLVMEADESDKGIGDYAPSIGVILNLQRDHDEPENMLPAFTAFKNNCTKTAIISDDPMLETLRTGSLMFGENAPEPYRIMGIDLKPDMSSFTFDGTRIHLPVPGLHNVHNAAAALTAGAQLGLIMPDMARALTMYQGVARRFDILRDDPNGVTVIDDYAHNPAKIAAVINTAAARAKRIILYFQPTGFGPTRFLRPDLVKMFAETMGANDELHIAPIPYMGGTAIMDISSDMLVDDIRALGRKNVSLAADRTAFINHVKSTARPGDVIAIVGGRDPSLPLFARDIVKCFPPLPTEEGGARVAGR